MGAGAAAGRSAATARPGAATENAASAKRQPIKATETPPSAAHPMLTIKPNRSACDNEERGRRHYKMLVSDLFTASPRASSQTDCRVVYALAPSGRLRRVRDFVGGAAVCR